MAGMTAQEAGIACDREMITKQIELLLNQLEKGKYTKQANWASRIAGGIEQLLYVRDGQSGGGAGEITNRMERMIAQVMQEKPDAPGLFGHLHPALADQPYHEAERPAPSIQQLYAIDNPPGPPVVRPSPVRVSEMAPGPATVNKIRSEVIDQPSRQ